MFFFIQNDIEMGLKQLLYLISISIFNKSNVKKNPFKSKKFLYQSRFLDGKLMCRYLWSISTTTVFDNCAQKVDLNLH